MSNMSFESEVMRDILGDSEFFHNLTFSIRIVADCVALSCQVTRKLKRATTLEFTTISAIIFIHCWRVVICFSFQYCPSRAV
jgi:hypothetical protein